MAMVQWSMKIPQPVLDRLQKVVDAGYFKNKNAAAIHILSQALNVKQTYKAPKQKLQKEKK